MSTLGLRRTRQKCASRSLAIVASQYNEQYVRGLVDHALAEIEAAAPGTSVAVIEVPGAFEIPLVVQEVASAGKVDAIIALGVIIEGETQHASLLGRSVTEALQSVALKYSVPVIHEVLLVRDEAQARARSRDGEMNRGREAAQAALRMVQVMETLKVR
jgi:6,7-dimethyl-8-ribityllumazine synthase